MDISTLHVLSAAESLDAIGFAPGPVEQEILAELDAREDAILLATARFTKVA